MREKRVLITGNGLQFLGIILSLCFLMTPAQAQMYQPDYYQQYYGAPGLEQYAPQQYPSGELQYDPRDAERILREQMSRQTQSRRRPRNDPQVQQAQPSQQMQQAQQQMYDNPYAQQYDEGQVQGVMGEARYMGSLIRQRNGKPFIIIDKRSFQFYLYDAGGRLLRIGPVAIGKGKTDVGRFETPVGVFPITEKVPVADWIRPDWYFIEENEPIPKRWEDRRVPGFFRYKLVFHGMKYIHYAEATGGRLTHGCLGLDWQDAEAVFHTLHKGSYCIIVDQPFLARLARGEFPIQSTQQAAKPADPAQVETVTARAERTPPSAEPAGPEDKQPFRSLW